jgi:hypothetical protein
MKPKRMARLVEKEWGHHQLRTPDGLEISLTKLGKNRFKVKER